MRHTPHKLIRPAAEEAAHEPLGFMSLQATAAHFGVSDTSIRLHRGLFVALRHVPINGRHMVVKEDVLALSRRLEREAMSADEVCATEAEERRAEGQAYREFRKRLKLA